MAWCRQATSHNLSQCWPRSQSPYDVTRPKWVNKYIFRYLEHICLDYVPHSTVESQQQSQLLYGNPLSYNINLGKSILNWVIIVFTQPKYRGFFFFIFFSNDECCFASIAYNISRATNRMWPCNKLAVSYMSWIYISSKAVGHVVNKASFHNNNL